MAPGARRATEVSPLSLPQRVRVRVPATTANLGPGFDALGLALELYEEVTLERLPEGSQPRVSITGVNAQRLRPDLNLLAYQGVAALYRRLDAAPPPLALELHTAIPRSGGLGGSAAAIVGGIVAANALQGGALHMPDLLDLATAVEGHPDNVSAALYGGLVITVQGRDRLIAKRLDPPAGLSAVVVIPRQSISTKAARGVLPSHLSVTDAVFNLSRTALLVAACLTGDWSLLRDAMDDRLHQPARGGIFPPLFPTIEAAVEAGAHGAALSGSGAAIVALASGRYKEIASAMRAAAELHGAPCDTAVLRLSSSGATVLETQG